MTTGFASFKGGQVKVDPRALAEFFRSPDGPLLRRMTVAGAQVKVLTIAKLASGQSRFPAEFLGPTIVTRITTPASGPRVLVGSDRAATRPHVIRGNPVLAFRWKKAPAGASRSGFSFFRFVHHPGSDLALYLLKQLMASAREVLAKL